MTSFLLLQQRPVCCVRLIWMFFFFFFFKWDVNVHRAAAFWDVASRIYSIQHIPLLHTSNLAFSSMRFVLVVHLYCRMDTSAAWNKSGLILTEIKFSYDQQPV